MRARGQGCFQRLRGRRAEFCIGTGGSAHRTQAAGGWIDHGHHALFAMASFVSAGGYDETFAANEDAELDARMTKADRRIWLSGEATVHYHPRRGPGALFSQYFRYGTGRARTLLRHHARPRLRQLLPAAVAPAMLLWVPALLVPVLGVPAVLWAAACLGYGVWLGIAARDPCAMMAGAAAMIMHLGWSLGFWSQLFRGPGPAFRPVPTQITDA